MHTQSWSEMVMKGIDMMYKARDGTFVLISKNKYKVVATHNSVYKCEKIHIFSMNESEIVMNYLREEVKI